MPPTTSRTRLFALAGLAALVGYFWWQGERFIAANGPTFDEGVHLAAGYSYWATGEFHLNREDPPLMKLLWAAPLALDGRPAYPLHVEKMTKEDHWKVADALLYQSGATPESLLAPARRVNLAFGCGVVLLAGWVAFRAWKSAAAGLAAAAFAAFDPNLLALSCVLSTDVGLTFFALLSAYALWEYAAAPSRGRMVAAGVSLGLMLAAKFSALGVVGGLVLAGVVWARRTKQTGVFDLAFRIGLIALVTVAATYGFTGFPEWGMGLKFQLTRGSHGDGVMYLSGELSRTGWYHYFAVVVALKFPLGLLVSGGTALLSGAASQVRRPVPQGLWLVLPPLVFLLAAALSRVNLGVRVILPILPFVYVLAARLAVGASWQKVILSLCVAWCAVASWRAAPDQIAYFNELGGGPKQLADSNLDWGQGLPQLKRHIDREGLGTIYLSYFGTDRPEAHGIRFQHLPGYGRASPPPDTNVPENEPRHVVAVSANHLLGLYLNDPDTFAFLRGRPGVVVGKCVHVFDLTGDPDALRQLREVSK